MQRSRHHQLNHTMFSKFDYLDYSNHETPWDTQEKLDLNKSRIKELISQVKYQQINSFNNSIRNVIQSDYLIN